MDAVWTKTLAPIYAETTIAVLLLVQLQLQQVRFHRANSLEITNPWNWCADIKCASSRPTYIWSPHRTPNKLFEFFFI